jgi:hypothetical protein
LGQLRNISCPIYRTSEKRNSNSQVSRDSTLKDQLQEDNCSMSGGKKQKKHLPALHQHQPWERSSLDISCSVLWKSET